MWREYLQRVLHWIGHVIRQPWEELNRWQRAARFAYDLSRYGAAQLREDRAPQMAAALSFQVLFALIPVLVIVMSIAQGFWEEEEFMRAVRDALREAGFSQVSVELTRVEATPADAKPAEIVTLETWMYGIIEQAADANLTFVNWLSYVLIIYAAVSTLVTVENSFNTIYRAPAGRSWARRVPLYWFLVTVSPISLSVTAFAHKWVDDWAQRIWPGAGWFAETSQVAWSIGFGWLFWFVVYSFVPNTTVQRKASAIGALVCVLLLETARRTMGAYLSNTFGVGQFYSSLGLIPLFMFWVYLMWLFVLFGLEVSATLQFLGNRAVEEIENRRATSGLVEPASVVSVMEVIAEDFATGSTTPQRRIADRTGVPERAVSTILQELCDAGLVHRIERDQNAVCLAQSPETVTADRLMDIGFRLADGAGERRLSQFAVRLREHQKALAKSVTLANLVPAKAV